MHQEVKTEFGANLCDGEHFEIVTTSNPGLS